MRDIEILFWGAFFGSFISFCFYLLSQFLVRFFPSWYKKLKDKRYVMKCLNNLYALLILRNNNNFFYNLIQLFRLEIVEKILKGNTSFYGNQIQFVNSKWEIFILNNIFQTRFTIKNIENQFYVYDINNREQNITILNDFLEDFEKNCQEFKIDLKLSKDLKFKREEIKKLR